MPLFSLVWKWTALQTTQSFLVPAEGLLASDGPATATDPLSSLVLWQVVISRLTERKCVTDWDAFRQITENNTSLDSRSVKPPPHPTRVSVTALVRGDISHNRGGGQWCPVWGVLVQTPVGCEADKDGWRWSPLLKNELWDVRFWGLCKLLYCMEYEICRICHFLWCVFSCHNRGTQGFHRNRGLSHRVQR